jgi:hypothetical protein
MLQLELHRMLQADRERDLQDALRRRRLLQAPAAEEADSDRVAGVAFGDGPGRRSGPGADLGRCQDLNPATRG